MMFDKGRLVRVFWPAAQLSDGASAAEFRSFASPFRLRSPPPPHIYKLFLDGVSLILGS